MSNEYKRTGVLPVLVVFAPTASGKTALGVELFGKDSLSPFAGKGEIISADSMQVYKGMDIGTAKPDSHTLEQVLHHLIDVQTPDVPFSVGEFVRQGDVLCQEIYQRNKVPVVLGGTGFYIRNFLVGLPPTPQADEELRHHLKDRLATEGAGVLYRELETLDPATAAIIHPNDEYRIVRALEVCIASGKPRSSFILSPQFREGFDFCVIILQRDREELYNRIAQRVDIMFDQGLSSEVENLIAAGYTPEDPGMQAIGYREFFAPEVALLQGEERLNRIKELITRNSRHYAKRQYTYMKGIPRAAYFHPDDMAGIQNFITPFMQKYIGMESIDYQK